RRCRSVRDVDRVGDEDEGLVRLDAVAARAVAEVGRDDQQPAGAFLDALEALVPARDDHAGAESELERFAAVEGAVQLLLVRPGHQRVVHLQFLAGLRARAGAGDEVLDDELLRRIAVVGDGDGGGLTEAAGDADVLGGAFAPGGRLGGGGAGGSARARGGGAGGRGVGVGAVVGAAGRQREGGRGEGGDTDGPGGGR